MSFRNNNNNLSKSYEISDDSIKLNFSTFDEYTKYLNIISSSKRNYSFSYNRTEIKIYNKFNKININNIKNIKMNKVDRTFNEDNYLNNINIKKNFNSVPLNNNSIDDIENFFIKRKYKLFKPYLIHNTNNIISFQRNSDNEILEYFVFNDNLIFPDLNRSYLQDAYSDDGDSSTDEQIENGTKFLKDELADAINDIYLKNKKLNINSFLSRKMKFKK